jgi:hypothetical protein
MDKNTKLQEKITKRNGYKAKLVLLYKNFRGVKHENSLSELQDSTIKVYEDIVRSLNQEIEVLKGIK